jgi:glycosyltransferase involved in cell wall biosynthesis
MAASQLQQVDSLRVAPRGEGMDALFVLNNLAVGGSETKVVRLANSLSARGMQIGIAYLNEPTTLLKDIQPQVGTCFLSRQGRFSLKANAALSRLINEQRPRNVLSVNLYPSLYVLTATRWARHKATTIGLMNTTKMQGARLKQTFYTRVLRHLDLTVYGCELQRDVWLTPDNPMRPRSHVIYNGVDISRFTPSRVGVTEQRARYGIGENTFVVGSVGRLAPNKNQLPLIDVIAELRAANADVHLVLVGDGPMRETLERRAAERGVSGAVTFTGALPDVRVALKLFDVFVLPSFSETFSNAALEAMAMQVPVILTRTGGAGEMIEDGREGYIIDVEQLPQRLPGLLNQLRTDHVLRSRMAAAAMSRAQQKFSWEGMLGAYQSLLGQSSSGSRQAVSHA